jgi:hypothetical protein
MVLLRSLSAEPVKHCKIAKLIGPDQTPINVDFLSTLLQHCYCKSVAELVVWWLHASFLGKRSHAGTPHIQLRWMDSTSQLSAYHVQLLSHGCQQL